MTKTPSNKELKLKKQDKEKLVKWTRTNTFEWQVNLTLLQEQEG